MKKSRLLGAVCAGLFSLITTSTNAALVDNGGGLIYDDVLDVTWAQPDIVRTWIDANTWASGLTLGGVSGWRLPYIDVVAGTGPLTNSPIDCSTATELACRDNELGYMLHQNLGGTANSPLFPTLQSDGYWSATSFDIGHAWYLNFRTGSQAINHKFSAGFSWAVHEGDVAVIPIPPALWLFSSGLLGMIGVARKKAAKCCIDRLNQQPI